MGLRERIDAFAGKNLPEDPEAWCRRYLNKPKIIHDGLWGTFELQSHEVALLDTPLLQRLRYLHQTGAVYLTYPSAHHTRFEHTLGALYQIGRLCQALRGPYYTRAAMGRIVRDAPVPSSRLLPGRCRRNGRKSRREGLR
jgi:hypothetical protein